MFQRKRYEPTTWKEKKIDELMTRWLWAESKEASLIADEICLIFDGKYHVMEEYKKKKFQLPDLQLGLKIGFND